MTTSPMAAKLPETVYVVFSAEIAPQTAESLLAVMARCVNDGVKHVHLLLSTPGGTTREGINLYNMLRAMPFELVTYNAGSVNSIGNVIFLAGSKRYAGPHSTFMFHGVGFNAEQGRRFEEKDLRERLDSILSDQNRIGAIIAQHTALDDATIKDLFREAQTKDAAYAVGCGIIDEIKDIQIPAGNTVISLVFQRQSV